MKIWNFDEYFGELIKGNSFKSKQTLLNYLSKHLCKYFLSHLCFSTLLIVHSIVYFKSKALKIVFLTLCTTLYTLNTLCENRPILASNVYVFKNWILAFISEYEIIIYFQHEFQPVCLKNFFKITF